MLAEVAVPDVYIASLIMSVEYVFHCNALQCRRPLEQQAVVTTCWCVEFGSFILPIPDLASSHIFCLQCADVLGLARAVNGKRVCPACDTELVEPDDCAVAQLQPATDYKGSILCGLTPSDIMECATKGIAFFTYQTTQEMQVLRAILTWPNADSKQSLSDSCAWQRHSEMRQIQDRVG